MKLDRYYNVYSRAPWMIYPKPQGYKFSVLRHPESRSSQLRDIIRRFMNDPTIYAREHFRIGDSELGFSVDKKSTVHIIFQRKIDRI